MLPIWLHSLLLSLLMTIAPAALVIFTLAYAPVRSFLGIDGANQPLPILMFLGLPVVCQLLFRYALKARCGQCGGQAKFQGAIPSRYVCVDCKTAYKTQIGPVKPEHRD
jgi:rRNA maturation protein Nop10